LSEFQYNRALSIVLRPGKRIEKAGKFRKVRKFRKTEKAGTIGVYIPIKWVGNIKR
jgi:hypothetical protein